VPLFSFIEGATVPRAAHNKGSLMNKASIIPCALVLLLAAFSAQAQVPNGGFERWTDGAPESWSLSNIPGFETVVQTNKSHSGASAAKGTVRSVQGSIFVPPTLLSGDSTAGFTVTQKYNSVSCYYQFDPKGGDLLSISVLMSIDSTLIAGNNVYVSQPASSWTKVSVPVPYFLNLVPNFCIISISIVGAAGGGSLHENSEFLVDDVELSMDVVSGMTPESGLSLFTLDQNYPNPVSSGASTMVAYTLPASANVTLTVYDALARRVSTLVNAMRDAGSHAVDFETAGLPAGLYTYVLEANGARLQKSMILTK
jgi:hypothetical protein